MKKRKGFSLMEMIVVVSVVCIMSAAGWSYIADYVKTAKYARASEQIALIANAVSLYKFENKEYPDTLDNLTENSKFNNSPYILYQAMPKQDPWGTSSTGIGGSMPYAYAHTDSGFAIWTFGENKNNNSGGGSGTLPSSFDGDDIGVFGQN